MKLSALFEDTQDLIRHADKLAHMPREKVQELANRNVNMDMEGIPHDRRMWVYDYSWPLPCKEAVDAIVKHSEGKPVYDVLAGTGYWAKILQDAGVNVIASDLHTAKKYNPYTHKARFTKIKRANAYKVVGQTVRRNEGHVILSWPPDQAPVGYQVLELTPVGTKVFYFGFKRHGYTGDDAMFDYLSKNFKLLEHVELPSFRSVDDHLWIYQKVSEDPLEHCSAENCRALAKYEGLCMRHSGIKEGGRCMVCGLYGIENEEYTNVTLDNGTEVKMCYNCWDSSNPNIFGYCESPGCNKTLNAYSYKNKNKHGYRTCYDHRYYSGVDIRYKGPYSGW